MTLRLLGLYPYLVRYHEALGADPDAIEALAEEAWRENAPPSAVLKRGGRWVTWSELRAALARVTVERMEF
jgi:hypothetical protein